MEIRNICFIRHAKSSWDNIHLDDIDRPLGSRGLRDAPFMAHKMNELDIIPDLLVSSPANRALTTAKFFAKEFNIPESSIQIENNIYGASADEIVSIVNKLSNQFQSVFLFGHNPTFTYLANQFADVNIDNVPTCGITQAKTMVGWEKFSPNTSAFTAFYYPKQYFK